MLRSVAALRRFALLALTPPLVAWAQRPDSSARGTQRLVPPGIDLPLVDAPYNFRYGGRAPSMAQSLAVSTLFYEAAHAGIERLWGARWQTDAWLARGTMVVLDYLILALPFGDAWTHEEFHRAVMGYCGIGSFDDVYKFDLAAEAIAVSHVKDADLVRLKAEHPAEQVRLSAAGLEGEQLLTLRLERNEFFGGSTAWHRGTYWLVKVGGWAYVASGTWSETSTETDKMNAREGADVRRRDFTGHDFTAWVYDLYRATEPYAARGVHPSGVGIDRYIKPSDFTPEEADFLRLQGKLELVNLLDPFLVGFRGATLPNGVALTARAGHALTPFGYAVEAYLFARSPEGRRDAVVTLRRYTNGRRSFPGVELELVHHPLPLGRGAEVAARAGAWQQPRDQAFRTSEAAAGGLLDVTIRVQLARGRVGFVQTEAKTAGWVPGTVQLEGATNIRVGVSTGLR